MGDYSGPYGTADPNKPPEVMDAEAVRAYELQLRGHDPAYISRALGLAPRTIQRRISTLRQLPPRGCPAYETVHRRIRDARGRAAERLCRECGGQAAQWAYTNDDPSELISGRGLRYSLDLDRYVPMCHLCHVRFDAAHRETA